jgi:NAD(P)-dependent dehydrogenase (short-subunit alcohol dehydrogenase family)
MTGELQGKVVMITGAAGGLGRGVVERCHAAGANLALIERQKSDMDRCLDTMSDTIDRTMCLSIEADVTDKTSVQNAVVTAVAHFGRLDALVHTVGGYASSPAQDVDLDVWDKMMTLNARSVFVTAGTVAHYMVENGISGSIVVVLARHAYEGQKNHAAYGASKAAAQRIMQSLSKELLEHNIRVNGVVPGTIDTPANREAMPNADFSTWVQPTQIGDVIVFLTSDQASVISGESVAVYGRS